MPDTTDTAKPDSQTLGAFHAIADGGAWLHRPGIRPTFIVNARLVRGRLLLYHYENGLHVETVLYDPRRMALHA